MKTYTIEITFVETDPRAGAPHACRRTWSGPGADEDDAIRRARKWFGFEEDGIEVTGVRVLDAR